MEVKYDKDADALYIDLGGEFASNKKVDDFTILDLDRSGNVIGIELLDVSKRFPRKIFSELSVKNIAVTNAT